MARITALRHKRGLKVSDQSHRFKIGQVVDLMPASFRSAAKGNYEIVRLVPCDSNDPQYYIKSKDEKHERVVPQRDLILVRNDST